MRDDERFETALARGFANVALAELTDELLRGGGSTSSAGMCLGMNTSPWNLEAGDRALEPGDLVFKSHLPTRSG